MLKAIIIDDEVHCRNELRNQLKVKSSVTLLAEAVNISEAEVLIKELQPDLIFLDIEMPGGTGFELLECFPEPNFQVIFTTGHNEYAIKAFKHSAIDYLLKPVETDDLNSALEKVLKLKGNDNNFEKLELMLKSMEQKEFSKIALPSIDSFEFVNKKDIIACEADGNYTMVYTADGKKSLTTHTLKKINELLQEKRFFRIHKSFVVNVNFVKKVLKSEGGQLVMENGHIIPIARRRKEEFLELIGM